jgi:hypothetical protein
MSVQARVNHLFGGTSTATAISFSGTIAAFRIPDTASWIRLTGTSTPVISALDNPSYSRNKLVILENAAATSITLTNNASTTTAGQMDLGSADITLATDDIVALYCRPNGVWIRAWSTDN